jgi:hypothetical protein
MSERCTRHSHSNAGNRSRQINDLVTTHTGGFVLFVSLAKRKIRLILIHLACNIFFLLQAMALRRDPSLIELFVEMHMRSEDRQKKVQQFIDYRAQYFGVCLFNHFLL